MFAVTPARCIDGLMEFLIVVIIGIAVTEPMFGTHANRSRRNAEIGVYSQGSDQGETCCTIKRSSTSRLSRRRFSGSPSVGLLFGIRISCIFEQITNVTRGIIYHAT